MKRVERDGRDYISSYVEKVFEKEIDKKHKFIIKLKKENDIKLNEKDKLFLEENK